jgi:hypothetical protein
MRRLQYIFLYYCFSFSLTFMPFSMLYLGGVLKVRSVFREEVLRGRPPPWSSGQSFWLQIQRSQVRFPALPDFLRSSGSWTGSTQPREDNLGATWKESSSSGLENRKLTAGAIFLLWEKKYYKYKKGLGNAHPAVWFVSLTTQHPLSAKVSTNFAD